ncbi:hypothetical protein DPMN_014153 [Dreissena polymorpha]|uniref:Uncharacterized protein n=1 Tax=Dreissena polymorpha TaxID=45954 RepID=A0A9D4NB54_DREPO|nr:hypothetical protein DPMN_014153 [Dreissena polymorpha]
MLKLAQTDRPTDQQTDQQTNRQTNRQGKNNMSPTTIVGDIKKRKRQILNTVTSTTTLLLIECAISSL